MSFVSLDEGWKNVTLLYFYFLWHVPGVRVITVLPLSLSESLRLLKMELMWLSCSLIVTPRHKHSEAPDICRVAIYSGLIKKKSHRLSFVPHSLYKPPRDTWLRIDFLKSIDLIQNTSPPVTRDHCHVKMVIRHIACSIVTSMIKTPGLRSVPCDHLLWTECSHHQPACGDRVV